MSGFYMFIHVMHWYTIKYISLCNYKIIFLAQEVAFKNFSKIFYLKITWKWRGSKQLESDKEINGIHDISIIYLGYNNVCIL